MKKYLLLVISILCIEIYAQNTPCEALYFESSDTCFTVNKNNTTFLGSGFTPNCGNYQGGDYWLTTTIPLSGNLTVESSLGYINSKVNIMVWIGNDCNTLTQISCYPDTATNNILTFSLYNYPVGSSIYIQLYEDGNNQIINKLICINNGNQNSGSIDSTVISLPEDAQQCINAVPFCLNDNYFLPGATGVNAEPGPNYECLLQVPNPTWVYFQCTNSGPLTLNISTGSGIDVDFITYGPFSSPNFPCTNGLNNSNIIDCSYSPISPETINYNFISNNQYYLILLTNYSNVDTYFNVSQTGGTGSIYCVPYNCDASLNSSPSCSSFSSGSVSANVLGAFPINYIWKDENGNTLLSETNAWSIDTLFSLSSGTYSISITTNDGCQIFESINVDVYKESYFSYTDSLFCINEISILPDSILTLGGVFSSQPILGINPSTGLIDVQTAMPSQYYKISYVTNNQCGFDTTTFELIFNSPSNSAYFSFDTTTFCNLSSFPEPDSILSPIYSNFFSIPNNLPIDQSSGKIYLNPFVSGVFDIINITEKGCIDTSVFQLTIQPYTSSYFQLPFDSVCFKELFILPDSITVGGGVFLSNNIQVDSSSGLIDLNSGTNNSGYTISYTHTGFCNSYTTTQLYITGNTSGFMYSTDTICLHETIAAPNYIQNQNGYFQCLNNNIDIDSITGDINLSNSLSGNYIIYRISNSYCLDTTSVNLTLENVTDASFSYPSSVYYFGDVDPYPIITNPGGVFSTTTQDLFLNTSTGHVIISLSLPGVYIVQYVTESVCNDTAYFQIEIGYDVSVENQEFKNMVLYPNPANKSTHLTGMKNFSNTKVEIINQLGKMCASQELSTSEIDVTHLEEGVYILMVYTDGLYLFSKKLIVSK